MDDRELVQRAADGDTGAFLELITPQTGALLLSGQLLTLADLEDVEELVCDVTATAYLQMQSLPALHMWNAWLFSLLRRRCLRRLVGADSDDEHSSSMQSYDLLPDLSDEDTTIYDHIKVLPYPSREILAARFVHRLRYREIAWALRLKPATVRNLITDLYIQLGSFLPVTT